MARHFKKTNSTFKHKRKTFTRGNVKITRGPSTVTLDRKIKRMENAQELKFVDLTTFNLALVAGTPQSNADLVENLANGSDINQRVGDSITMTSLKWKLSLIGRNNLQNQTYFRVLIVQDKQPNTNPVFTLPVALAAQTVNDFWQFNSSLSSLDTPQLWMYNHQNIGRRFKVLYDKVCSVMPQTVQTVIPPATITVGQPRKFLNINIKKRVNIQYTPNAAATDTTNKNKIWFVVLSEQAADFESTQRMYYKDD